MGAPQPQPETPVGDGGNFDALRERLDRIVLSGDELPVTLRAIVEAMVREGLRGACIALVDERDELYIAAWQGTVDRAVLDLRLPVGQGVMGTVVSEARPLVIRDYDDPPPGLRLATRNVGTNRLSRSCVAVPIWSDGVVIGVLQMGSREVAAFDDGDVALLTVVAEAIAEAVRRVEPGRLANELLQRRVRELTFLQDTAADLRTTLEPDGVAERLVTAARSGLVGGTVALVAFDEHGARVLARDAGDGPVSADASVSGGPAPTWLAGVVADGRCTTLTRPEWNGWAAAVLGPTPPVAIAAAVLQSDQRTLLLVVTGTARGFDPAQCRLLEGVASLGEMALANAVAYRRLHEAARRDPATGLLTRAAFEGLLVEGNDGLGTHAVLVVDIDNLRAVNDGFGHEAGDALIAAVAEAVAAAVGDDGIVSRSGGDEFSILLPGVDDDGARLAEEVRRVMHGVQVPYATPRVSVGHARGEAGDLPTATFNAAARAMRRAKRWGRDRVAGVDPGAVSDDDPQWERLLPGILADRSLRTVLQPIVELGSGVVTGYEALARPAGTTPVTSVSGLFAAAQSMGAARDLDWLCRRIALRDAGGLPGDVALFLNVGVVGLLDPLHDVDQLLLLLEWAGRDPASIVLEITEREAVGDLPRFREVLAAYRQHGVGFAIDDVGEGHSTLEVLAASSPEFIKLAAGLVQPPSDRGAAAAVSAVVAFAHATGARVIAEGIETEEQRERMRSHGVELGQGWLLGLPVEAASFCGTGAVLIG